MHDFPEEYHLYKQKWIDYNHIKQANRNRLLWRNDKVDGIKTGHTDEAGYCLIASAVDGDMRLINVQLGAPTDSARTNNTQALLTWGMRFYETKVLQNKLTKVTKARVWGGEYEYTPVGIHQNLYVTVPKGQLNDVQLVPRLKKTTDAPVRFGESFGELDIVIDNQVIDTKPLFALAENNVGSIWRRMADSAYSLWDSVVA